MTNDSPSIESKRTVNYVFVDVENVADIDPAKIGEKAVHFTLLLGVNQTKLKTDLVEKLVAHSSSVQLIRLSSSGPNALDFALAFYLGKAASEDPMAYFHVVSKDKGYDPLIEHLKSRKVSVRRHDDFKTLTFSAPVKHQAGGSNVASAKAKVKEAVAA